ncbi:alkaline shock response membrane anchor protein AmaP [Halarsenatibacter silvermanii]|uniref:Alkaline shock response membrane anchor protein AmaP n=1 Tax=Halarsenatibacter silvermanii TaxID=321763 RepID=A0A1G9JYZ1_9FIRM|nr:alkaline shock response membrane anchor protein AmaP [Halarsenatibacter silvermanii]SDL42404.1 hypothetical protein SAMN04488692_104119 [Halarsenatibacter silvermanii]
MNFVNKIILILLLAALMVLSLILALFSFAVTGEELLAQLQEMLYGSLSAGISFSVIFVLAAWSIYPFFKKGAGTALISSSEEGEVSISLKAMNKIIREVAGDEDNVDIKDSEVNSKPDGLYARLSISVTEKGDIPSLTSRLQRNIKNRLRNITGAEVISVEVMIENVETEEEMEEYHPREESSSTEELSSEEREDEDKTNIEDKDLENQAEDSDAGDEEEIEEESEGSGFFG